MKTRARMREVVHGTRCGGGIPVAVEGRLRKRGNVPERTAQTKGMGSNYRDRSWDEKKELHRSFA